jgi:hypothetical protein
MDEKEAKALAVLDGHLTVSEGRLYDHISSMFKWLVATLFAANGGALLSMTHTSRDGGPSCSAWFFGIGLICSIAVGMSSSLVAMLSSRDITVTRTQIQIATLNGMIDDALRTKLSTVKSASIWIWTPVAIGVFSFLMLTIGLVVRLTSVQ